MTTNQDSPNTAGATVCVKSEILERVRNMMGTLADLREAVDLDDDDYSTILSYCDDLETIAHNIGAVASYLSLTPDNPLQRPSATPEAYAVMNPQSGGVSAPSTGQLYNASAVPDEVVEMVAQFLHDEGGFDEAWDATWPEHPDDTGQREGGFVRIVPSDVQAKFRDVARRLCTMPQINAQTAEVSITDLRELIERIPAAIKATEYKYFGYYEMSDNQHEAVDVLVAAATALTAVIPAIRAQAVVEERGKVVAWLRMGEHVHSRSGSLESEMVFKLIADAIERGEHEND